MSTVRIRDFELNMWKQGVEPVVDTQSFQFFLTDGSRFRSIEH